MFFQTLSLPPNSICLWYFMDVSPSHGPSINHILSLKRDAANQVIVIREELRCDVGISVARFLCGF